MEHKNIEDMRRELENVIIGFFIDEESSYWHLHAWEKYRIVEETISHLFKRHKKNFNHLNSDTNNLSDDTIELEQKLFVSWTALSAYHRLNAIGSLYREEAIPFYKNN